MGIKHSDSSPYFCNTCCDIKFLEMSKNIKEWLLLTLLGFVTGISVGYVLAVFIK
jgi:hypothetical protein